jgi:hypothetical protein
MDESKTPPTHLGIVPLSNFVPRGFGFAHHSIAILYHEVPNPNLTIRHFSIAVSQREGAWRRGECARGAPSEGGGGGGGCTCWKHAWQHDGLSRSSRVAFTGSAAAAALAAAVPAAAAALCRTCAPPPTLPHSVSRAREEVARSCVRGSWWSPTAMKKLRVVGLGFGTS